MLIAKKFSLIVLSFMLFACGPTSSVPRVEDTIASSKAQAAQGESKPVQGSETSTTQKDLDAAKKNVEDLQKSLEALNKELDSNSKMSAEERQRVQEELAKKTAELELEKAKQAELEKVKAAEEAAAKQAEIDKAAAAAKAAQAAGATAKTSGKLNLVYGTDCLDFLDASAAAGAALIAYPCKGTTSQQFVIETTAANASRIVNVNSNKCLTLEGNAVTEKTRLVQQVCKRTGDPLEMFTFVDATTAGTSKIKNVASGLCLKTGTDGGIFLGNCTTTYTYYQQK